MTRFDIVLGHYVYYALWHGGQWSWEYERLCRIGRYFRPGAGANALNLDCEENAGAREVYLALCDKHGHKHEGEVRA